MEITHVTYCLEKVVPSKCLCTISNGDEECGAHTYARTVNPHSVEECTVADVYVEEKEIE